MPSWIFCNKFCSSVANLMLHYTLPFTPPGENSVQLHKRVSWRAAARPKHPHQSCAEAGQGPGLVQQPLTAFLSHPPASPIPALSSQPGQAAGVSCTRAKQQLCASCSHHASAFPGRGRVLLSPLLCAARRQRVNRGTLRGKSVKRNIAAMGIVKCGLTWTELHG